MTLHFIYSVVNFTILVLALYFLLKKPSREFFRKRSTTTRVDIDRARKFYDEAAARYQEIDEKLKNADSEAQQLLNTIRHDGELEKQRILLHAREAAQRIKYDSERIIAQEVKKAKQALKSETTALAMELAAQKIKSGLSVEDQKALSGEFLEEVKHLKEGQS